MLKTKGSRAYDAIFDCLGRNRLGEFMVAATNSINNLNKRIDCLENYLGIVLKKQKANAYYEKKVKNANKRIKK